MAQLVKNLPAMCETWFHPWDGKVPWRRERLPTSVSWPREFNGLYTVHGVPKSPEIENTSPALALPLCHQGIIINIEGTQKNMSK